MRQVVNVAICRKNLRNLTRNSWNCGFRRVTLFFGTTGCAAVVTSKGKLPYASQLNSKSKNKTLTKIPRKTCLKSLQFVLSFCKLCLIFGLWLWHLPFGTSIGRNFGPIQRKFDVIFWWLYLLHKWVCYYIGICSTNIGNDYYISEMSAMNLLKLWKCERNIDFDVKFYTLYRKVKGNLSMIIVIDITSMK